MKKSVCLFLVIIQFVISCKSSVTVQNETARDNGTVIGDLVREDENRSGCVVSSVADELPFE